MYPFKDGSFAVRNGWYVAAFAYEAKRELLSRWILNEPVVIYRKENGDPVAIGGRCPHRHFPLGKGCLKGDAVVCGYHGISFGADGRCQSIPSQQAVPKAYSVPTYPLVQHGIWLFIWMGDPIKADPALLPDLNDIGVNSPDMVIEPFYVEHVEGRYQLLNDNLLDLTHLAFLHGTTIGTPESASTPDLMVKKPGLLSSRRTMVGIKPPPAIGNIADKIDRLTGMDFYMPGFHAGIDEMRLSQDDSEKPGHLIKQSRVYHAVTPASHTTCNYFFAMATLRGEGLKELRDYLKPVIEEDKFATQEIEKMLKVIGENPRELLIRSDKNAAEGRRMLQAMMDAEAPVFGRDSRDSQLEKWVL